MVKLAISALVIAQLCLLQAQASHYIQFKLIKDSAIMHRAGICIHNGDNMLLADMDYFGSGVKNYGFHENGYSANVNWDNENVGVDGWGTYWFQDKTPKDKKVVHWEGCWETSDSKCAHFREYAELSCAAFFNNMP